MEGIDSINQKRVRTLNFSLEENLLVLNTAAKYKHILENKRTDSVTWQEKNKIWEEITRDINAKVPSGCCRSMQSLKRFYENEKKRARKVVAEDKKEINLTGGGPPTRIKKDPCHELILSIVNNKTVYGLNNLFNGDSDCNQIQNVDYDIIQYRNENYCAINNSVQAMTEQNKIQPVICPVSIHSTQTEVETDEELVEVNQTWKKHKPADFQIPVSAPLQKNILCATSVNIGEANLRKERNKNPGNKCRRPATTVKRFTSSNLAEKYEMLINKKLEVVDLQKQKLQNEMEILQVEHKFKVKLLEKELELKEQHVMYQK